MVLVSIERLLEAVGYPKGETSLRDGFTVLQVDGWELQVREDRGRLVLSHSLGAVSAEKLRELATLAAGRILREEAVLAWDPASGAPLLWQAVPSSATSEQLRRVFEVFCSSCEWWDERLKS